MIKYDLNNINDWYFNSSDIIKVYRNNAVCYYKITTSGGTTAQTPCFAVVEDISQYSDTEFEDVFNQADDKWYKLNNLNDYEEYGVYGSGRTICTGETPSQQSYKYWMWRSVGEIVGRPNNYIQFSEFDLSVNDSDVSLSYISASPTGVTNETADKLFDNDTSTKYCANFGSYLTTNYILFESQSAIAPTSFAMTTANDNASNNGRYPKNWVLLGSNTSTTNWDDGSWNLVLSGTCGNEMKADFTRFDYPISVTPQECVTTYDGKLTIDDGYEYMYSGGSWINVGEVSGSTYPVYYDVIQDPPNNLTFSSMTEAEEYECPWVGMIASIDGDRYVFSGDSISGYEWVYSPIDYSTHYLTFVAETDNVSFNYSTATSSNKLQYSLDSGSTWNDLGSGQSTTSVNSGQKVMFKASGLTVNTDRGIGKITPSAAASVEGNIMSLAYGDDFSGQTVISNNYQFRRLFSGVTTITSAENMVMPATTVKQQCYSQMFQGCTNLVTAPSVIGSSAMTWSGEYCCSDMFHSCTSLTTMPQLPAMNLGTRCYWCMFVDCTSLTTALELPSETLANYCYYEMFKGCTSLTTAPELPATTLASYCYNTMFDGCTNLNYIKAMFTTTPSTAYMNNWVRNVAASGTFVKNSAATWVTSCGSSTYPCDWTIQNA